MAPLENDSVQWILLTASRKWKTREHYRRMHAAFIAIQRKLAIPPSQIGITHGAAEGGDKMGDGIAAALGWQRDPVPCTDEEWERYGKSAGHRRNARMVARHTYRGCVAAPLGVSSGTRGCMKLAKAAGITVWNIGDPSPSCIREITDNIFAADTEAVVNPVNTVGVMGAGLALQFKRAYPDMFREYAAACRQGVFHSGNVMVFHTGSHPQYVINFATKQDWRQPSRLEWIDSGPDQAP